jgi:transcriptional regulator with XRE-family HTH domain
MQGKKEILSVVRSARQRTKLSQVEFGRLLEVNLMTVQRYELGKRKVPPKYFERCKNILKTPKNELEHFLDAFKQRTVFFQNEKLLIQLPRAS